MTWRVTWQPVCVWPNLFRRVQRFLQCFHTKEQQQRNRVVVPGRCCSPRHKLPFHSSRRMSADDLEVTTAPAAAPFATRDRGIEGSTDRGNCWMTQRAISARPYRRVLSYGQRRCQVLRDLLEDPADGDGDDGHCSERSRGAGDDREAAGA